ncbi:MAG: aminotransferase class III-fold pyridoxal phosphate-dependent enzyme, partial [Acidobacteria bacterium]|nr:aminotransferase class III-fold pyridoxal phosphate-dependent enzyme [Acidobacteriota bacterium]
MCARHAAMSGQMAWSARRMPSIPCGSGRTGKFFASEHEHFKPDILVLGKGLNA